MPVRFARRLAAGLGWAILLWNAPTGSAFASRLEFGELAPGVYAAIAPNEAPSPANGGFVSNLGFIVGRNGVIAIGTGVSERQGRAILGAIRRVTPKPVVLAINLQATPEHVLGNRSFARRGIPILAHRETDRFMVQNCPRCIRNARGAIGRRMGAASLARPTRLIDATTRLTDGGTDVEIRHYGHTFQAGSLAVYDRRSDVLFAGEMISLERIPDVRNADLASWDAALAAIAGGSARLIVPAHGPVAEPQRVRELARYLADLRERVADVYDRGVAMQDAAAAAALPDYAAWALYPDLHRSNIHFTFLRVEALDLAH